VKNCPPTARQGRFDLLLTYQVILATWKKSQLAPNFAAFSSKISSSLRAGPDIEISPLSHLLTALGVTPNRLVTDRDVTLEKVSLFISDPDLGGDKFLGKYLVAGKLNEKHHRIDSKIPRTIFRTFAYS
jgi:hypothetical protein